MDENLPLTTTLLCSLMTSVLHVSLVSGSHNTDGLQKWRRSSKSKVKAESRHLKLNQFLKIVVSPAFSLISHTDRKYTSFCHRSLCELFGCRRHNKQWINSNIMINYDKLSCISADFFLFFFLNILCCAIGINIHLKILFRKSCELTSDRDNLSQSLLCNCSNTWRSLKRGESRINLNVRVKQLTSITGTAVMDTFIFETWTLPTPKTNIYAALINS